MPVRIERIAVVTILALVVATTLRWVCVVPIFEANDEDLHFDYVMSIYSAGRLLLAQELPVAEITRLNPLAPNTHPVTHHLAVRSGVDRIRFHPGEKVPAGYGTREFFQRVNATMPPDEPQVRNPWLISAYPFGYYALTAAWLRVVSLWRAEPITLFFAARLFSVVLLVISLSIGYLYLRRIGTSARRAIGLLAVAGLIPYTSFVASYVQPDNLAFTMTMAAGYAALVARQRIREHRSANALLCTGLALGALLVTKYHFFLCVAVPCLATLVTEMALQRPQERRWLRNIGLLLLPSLITAAIQMEIHVGADLTSNARAIDAHRAPILHSLGWPMYVATRFREAIVNYFGGGPSFRGFWGVFGWYDTPLVIGNDRSDDFIRFALLAGSLIVLVLMWFRLVLVASRLVRIARRRPATAARVAFSNPLANSYFLFAGFMVFVYVWLNNFFHAQARNWFPYTLIILWLAVEYAPRALQRRRAREFLSLAVLIVLAVYTVAGALYAIPVLRTRFY